MQRQQAKMQANLAHTKIEFYDTKELPLTSKINLNSYQSIKQTGFQGITTHAYSVPPKEQRTTSRGPFKNPQIINKMYGDDQSNMVPHKHPSSGNYRESQNLSTYYRDNSPFISSGQVTSSNLNFDQQHPYFSNTRQVFNPSQLIPSTQSSQVFGAKIELNPRKDTEREKLSRQSSGRNRISKNITPHQNINSSTNYMLIQNLNEGSISRQIQPQPSTSNQGGAASSLSTYNFTNTVQKQQIGDQNYEINAQDIALMPEQRRLKSQRPGHPQTQIRYNAIDMATVALLSQQMQLTDTANPHQIPNTEEIINISHNQHIALKAKPIFNNNRINNRLDYKQGNFQLDNIHAPHYTLQYEQKNELIKDEKRPSIISGPQQDQNSGFGGASFHMGSRINQTTKKGLSREQTQNQKKTVTPKGGTQKLTGINQLMNDSMFINEGELTSSRGNAKIQQISNSPQKRYTINETISNRMIHPAIGLTQAEIGLQKASMFHQGANIGLPDIYFINQPDAHKKGKEHMRAALGASTLNGIDPHRYKHAVSNLQKDQIFNYFDDFLFSNQPYERANTNLSRGGSAALAPQQQESPLKRPLIGAGRPSLGASQTNQNHLLHINQNKGVRVNDKYQNIIDTLISEQIPVNIHKNS